MGYLMFFLAAVAACLLWSATFVAAAARTERTWLRRLLVAVAIAAPLALLPLVLLTGSLEIVMRPQLSTRWFPPTLTAFLSAVVGGVWIAAAGLSIGRFTGDRVAARWPVIGLAGLFVAAKLVTVGILLILENAVAAQAPYLRIEAAQLMQANLPPVVSDADNAATLYTTAFAALEADPARKLEDGPLSSKTIDPSSEAAAELLARQANTIDVLRRAADREGCRFARDWTRPSLDMILPHLGSIRVAARLMALSARRLAAAGEMEAALGDVTAIHRMARHVGSEPILVSVLVGAAIDQIAEETLCTILPALEKSDLPLLDRPELRNLLDETPSLQAAAFGEEAHALSTYADMAADSTTWASWCRSTEDVCPSLVPRIGTVYRSFLLPSEISGYREILHRYQDLASKNETYAKTRDEAAAIEASLMNRTPGLMVSAMVPAISAVFKSQFKAKARKLALAAVVEATRKRLETGSLPEVLPSMPRDPFTEAKLLMWKQADGRLTVYSVGPDGEDDGGPPAPGVETPEGNDDVGLSIAL